MTRARDVADTQDNNGGAVSPFVAGKNFIVNGGFDFFQRGSFNSQTASNYTLDRWYSGVGGTVTVTQQSSGAPVGSPNYMRIAYNAASSFANQFQALESSVVQSLVGRTITASFLIRANATWTGTASQGLNFYIEKNATANALVIANWNIMGSTTITANLIPTGSTASDWYRVTVTCSVPNDGTANGIRLRVGESVAGPSGAYWEMAQVQLEVGSVATPFSRAGGTLIGEFQACQRYFETGTDLGTTPGNGNSVGTTYQATAYSTGGARVPIFFKVTKRSTPTMTYFRSATGATNGQWAYYSGAWIDSTAIATDTATNFMAMLEMTKSAGFVSAGSYLVTGVWTASSEL